MYVYFNDFPFCLIKILLHELLSTKVMCFYVHENVIV